MRIFKISIKFNSYLSNRGGRFLTIYDTKGKKINGKVLTTRFLWAKVQHAKTGKTQWVKNWQARVVVADHEVLF
jgi:hypothetical protein